jgi:hypothetical protein
MLQGEGRINDRLILTQEYLGRTNCTHSFDETWTAQKKKRIKGHTQTHQQEGDLISLIHLNNYEGDMQMHGQTQTDIQTKNSKVNL